MPNSVVLASYRGPLSWLVAVLLAATPLPTGLSLPRVAPSQAAPEEPSYDWLGVIGTGQSLAVGMQGQPVRSTRQPYGNLKLMDPGPRPRFGPGSEERLRLVPLVEPIHQGPDSPGAGPSDEYPDNIYGETPHTSMANLVTVLSQRDRRHPLITVHSVVGWSGHALRDLNKSGPGAAYPGSLREARATRRLADEAHQRLAYGAVVLTHGEADWNNERYGEQVYALFQDYNQDLKEITGQQQDIVLLATQQSTYPGDSVSRPRSMVGLWQAGVKHPGQVVCVGPKYQYPYADRLHLTAAGYSRLGEKYAQVFHEVVVMRRPWQPLQPIAVRSQRTTIDVRFHVPVPPLAFETSLDAPHQQQHLAWSRGRGFEVEDDSGPVNILDAVLAGHDRVVLHLGRAPGPGAVVRYAMTQDSEDLAGGTAEGRRGQLRDSDPFVGLSVQTLSCIAVTRSATLRCSGASDRSPGDRVSGAGVARDSVIRSVDGADQITLSAPYSGASGPTKLIVTTDHRNYAVHFEWPLSATAADAAAHEG